MMPPAWRVRWWRWALPLLVVLANAALLIVHPGRTGAGFAVMDQELKSETRTLAGLNDKERAMETVLADARTSRESLIDLYDRGFATEAERLTRLITEVKRLSQRAGLVPKSISYPEQKLDDYGLVRLSLVFVVQGSYSQLRMLINLLEHSDLFLVLDRVGLSNSEASRLGINLEISTFFVREPAAGRPDALAEPKAEPKREAAAPAPAAGKVSSRRSTRS
jgi:hypothetical protein